MTNTEKPKNAQSDNESSPNSLSFRDIILGHWLPVIISVLLAIVANKVINENDIVNTKKQDNQEQTQKDPSKDLIPKCKIPITKGDSACWIEVSNHKDCYVWSQDPYINERKATWIGQCKGRVVDGIGTVQWTYSDSSTLSDTGTYANGKRHGEWKEQFLNGSVGKGLYVNGKRHGKWKFKYKDGVVIKGFYVDGKLNDELTDMSISTFGGFLLKE